MQTLNRRTAALALALAAASGSAQAGQSSRLNVTAVVVHSMRLQVAPRPVELASAAVPAVRAVAAPGGTFYVVGFDVGMNGAASPAAIGLHVRPDGASAKATADVRFHEGRGGAWNRALYGAALPSGAQGDLSVAAGHSAGGEVGVFVAKGAAPQQVDVVVTVLADAAPVAAR